MQNPKFLNNLSKSLNILPEGKIFELLKTRYFNLLWAEAFPQIIPFQKANDHRELNLQSLQGILLDTIA